MSTGRKSATVAEAVGMRFTFGAINEERTAQVRAVVDARDPADFWSSLTPAQIRALLAAAPKVAGPWVTLVEKDSREPAYAFRALGQDAQAAFVELRYGRFEWTTCEDDPDNFRPEHAPTMDAAKQAADAALIEAGYVLDTPTTPPR